MWKHYYKWVFKHIRNINVYQCQCWRAPLPNGRGQIEENYGCWLRLVTSGLLAWWHPWPAPGPATTGHWPRWTCLQLSACHSAATADTLTSRVRFWCVNTTYSHRYTCLESFLLDAFVCCVWSSLLGSETIHPAIANRFRLSIAAGLNKCQ